jgi:outer membrane protein TolC
MIKTVILLLLLFVCFSYPAAAETLTLNDFYKQVLSKHPFFKKQSLSAEIERKEQEKSLGDQDWVIRAKPFYAHEEGSVLSSFTPDELDLTSMNAALDRTFWKTGGQLTFAYDYTRTDQKIDDLIIPLSGGAVSIPGNSGIFHANEFAVTYSHPLLQNRGGILSRLNYDLQGYTVSATDLTVLENQENFLLDIGDLFLDWVLLTEQQEILQKRLQLAQEELERTERKREKNLVEKVDVIRARDAVLNAEQNVLGIEALRKAKQIELATIGQYRNPEDLKPQYNIYALVPLSSPDDSIEHMKQNSRVLNVFRVLIEQLEHRKKGAEERSRPRLNFNVSGGLKSDNDDYSESFDYDKPVYSVGLDFSYPLGNRSARADILKTQLEKELVHEDMMDTALELESNLRNLMTRIAELEKVLAINKEQIKVAKEKTDAELDRYNKGKIELTFVLQSRDNEQNVQLIYAQNGAVYHKLLLRYQELMDELFVLTP